MLISCLYCDTLSSMISLKCDDIANTKLLFWRIRAINFIQMGVDKKTQNKIVKNSPGPQKPEIPPRADTLTLGPALFRAHYRCFFPRQSSFRQAPFTRHACWDFALSPSPLCYTYRRTICRYENRFVCRRFSRRRNVRRNSPLLLNVHRIPRHNGADRHAIGLLT